LADQIATYLFDKMNNQTSVRYSIVVPARNEEETIGEVLRALRNMTDDLVVVDGHSSDRTVEIAATYGARVVKDNGKGKGDALRLGLDVVRHPITVFIDADGSHDPRDIYKLVDPIAEGRADLVMGSRMLGGSEELFGSISEVIRLMGSLVISLSINYRYGVRFTDYQNGFRAIRTDIGRAIGLTSNITTIEQEMAIKCLRYGYRVVERPTHEYRRRAGVSKINVMRTAHVYVWNLISELVRLRKSTGKKLAAANNRSSVDKELSPEAGLSSNSGLACPSCGCMGERMTVKKRRALRLCRCNSCGFSQQSDLAALDLKSLYGDDYYESWGIRQNPDDVWKMKLKTSLLYLDCLGDYLPEGLPSPRLLDIGCAHGFMLAAAQQRGFEPIGLEI
jgi:dolichol-phosphate mannosyltransferase